MLTFKSFLSYYINWLSPHLNQVGSVSLKSELQLVPQSDQRKAAHFGMLTTSLGVGRNLKLPSLSEPGKSFRK